VVKAALQSDAKISQVVTPQSASPAIVNMLDCKNVWVGDDVLYVRSCMAFG